MKHKNVFSEKNQKQFYENYFFEEDYQSFRHDVGSFCTRKEIISQITHCSGNLLEIGTGISSLLLDLQNFNCYGIDISQATIQTAEKIFEKSGKKAQFIVANAETLPFQDNFFDVIISSHTFEHIKNDHKVIQECSRVLKPSGELIIFVPGRKSGLSTREEIEKFGHYRYYNLSRFKDLEKSTEKALELKKIYYPHKIHNLIWNKLKHFVRWINYPIKRWILKDNKTYEIRPTYQKIILPALAKILDSTDNLVKKSEKNFLGTEFNVLVKFEKSKNPNF